MPARRKQNASKTQARDLEVGDGLDLEPRHGHEQEFDLGVVAKGLAVGLGQQVLQVPADLVHVAGEQPAGRHGLAYGLAARALAGDHLVWYPSHSRHVSPVLVQQPGEVLARGEHGLRGERVVPWQGIHVRIVCGRIGIKLPRTLSVQCKQTAGEGPATCLRITFSRCHTLCASKGG